MQSHVSRQFTVTSVQPEQKQLDFIPQQCSNLQASNVLLQPMHQQLSQGHIQVPDQQHPYGNLLEQQGQQPPQLGLSKSRAATTSSTRSRAAATSTRPPWSRTATT